MKYLMLAIALLGSFALAADTQTGPPVPKYLALTSGSDVPMAIIADSMDKKCSMGVRLTANHDKADYLLQAETLEKFHKGSSKSKAEFVLLSKDGDVLFHSQKKNPKDAMKEVCQDLGLRKTK
jgi:hypothetical protein